jgi:hypothetical protein
MRGGGRISTADAVDAPRLPRRGFGAIMTNG